MSYFWEVEQSDTRGGRMRVAYYKREEDALALVETIKANLVYKPGGPLILRCSNNDPERKYAQWQFKLSETNTYYLTIKQLELI